MLLTGCISTAPPAAAPTTPAAPPAPTTAPNGTTVNVSTPTQPCCPHETLWQFLGVTGGAKFLAGIIERIRNRLGSVFPGLESTPPVLAITDPKMAASSNPAEAAAAGAKADEDAAPQKIKAIRYLATLGCAGCYPGIEDALLESLDDCTEEVRYEAAKALRELSGKPCSTCKTKSCCSPKVLKKLDEVANKMEKGCYKEPSARVRREARLAMAGCGGSPPTNEAPKEGPSEGPPGSPQPVTASESAPNGGEGGQAGAVASTSAERASPSSSNAIAGRSGAAGQPRVAILPADSDCGCGQTQSVVVQTTPAAKATHSATASTPAPALAPQQSESSPAARIVRPATVSVIRSSGAVLAEVNGELVFESEVAPEVDRQLANFGPSMSLDEKLRQRPIYIRRELARVIDRKLLCQEARRASPQVTQAAFDAADGDEATIATAWLKGNIRVDETVTQEQLIACYRANWTRFEQPAAVRYEQLTAPVDRFASRDEAKAAIEVMRNRALGIPQPPFGTSRTKAVEAKTFDWTRKDQIPSARIAQMLFTMPIGAISEVIEGTDGWRVLRVLERHGAGPAPLESVADAVRLEILRERHDYLEEAYMRQLRGRARIWTAFDQSSPKAQVQGVRPLAD
jgi:hypothetical protein